MSNMVSPADLTNFADMLQTWLQTNWAQVGNVGPLPTIQVMTGPKYARLVVINYGDQRSAYAFVDLSNGDLLKCDGWKKPAKGKRGNIFAAMPLNGCTPYGMAYFK